MPVFISYSHRDAEMVDKFTVQLANNDIKVLRDAYRILPGDRFADEIYDWIASASSACIFISKHSTDSEWVAAEIDACHRRLGEDRKFAVIPVVLDNTAPPESLRDRVFVDARGDFDAALRQIIAVIRAAEQASAQGRGISEQTAYLDFGVHSEYGEKDYRLELDVVSYDTHETYSILSQFIFQAVVERVWETMGFDDPKQLERHLLKTCAEAFGVEPAITSVTSSRVRRGGFKLSDDSGAEIIDVSFRISTLGQGPRGTVQFNPGALFLQICGELGIKLDAELPTRGSLGGPIVS